VSRAELSHQTSHAAIECLNQQRGEAHRLHRSDQQQPLICGQFLRRRFSTGLNMHAVDVTELQDAKSATELQPCISFNLAFHGEVDFSLGEKRFCLKSRPDKVVCSAIVVAKPEVFTRHLQAERRIKKVNVTAPLTWLADRCQHAEQRAELERLLAEHCVVMEWLAEEHVSQLAEVIVASCESNDLLQELELELQVMQLLTLCMARLMELKAQAYPQLAPVTEPLQVDFNQQLDQHLDRTSTLTELADLYGMSVSTLQRRFKAQYGITVQEYLRIKRLERAKSELLIKGVSIGEAAYQAGYNHSSNFIAAFKKAFSVTPAQLLKLHQLPVKA